ncbi:MULTISPECIES: efflux transporter outer membrane subunit [Providencia]|uniref:efflux transporter outer membrane subunit n=1 Tax=Providencia TaxID=586 RepID=UPI001B362AAA|nr:MULTISPECIES: efflux transporter outer membrane subunit [Providencia]MBQ0368433.1 efflux transporter outer membrane subunit [Providencia rettgeri]
MNKTVIALVLLALTGCQAVGPDFSPPQASLPGNWGAMQNSATLPTEWWAVFGDPQLTQLVQRATTHNLNLQLATTRIQQSRALLGITDSALTPDLNFDGAYQRQRDPSGKKDEADFNNWQGGFSAIWEIDLWGKLRRSSESALANFAASEENRRALFTSIAAEIAANYLRLRATQQQIIVAKENHATALKTLQLTKVRLKNGSGNQLDVEQAQVQLDQVKALLPVLNDRENRLNNALSLLLSEQPGALKTELAATKSLPHLTSSVPMGLPSELALRRPDIREAEQRLHQATAEIGVAKADYYPRITLTGNAGYQVLSLSDMGNWSTRSFSIGPSLYLPLFNGGKITQQVKFSEYRQQEMAIAYQQTVLRAWHEIDDALSDYQTQQIRQSHLATAVSANQHAFSLARDSYLNGASDFIHVLSTQRALLDLQSAQIASQEETALAVVNLYRALGGGWEQTYPSNMQQEHSYAQHNE